MNSKEKTVYIEPFRPKELDAVILGQWLGGILEAEGSIKFDKLLKPSGKNKKLHAWPVIRFSNTNTSFLEQLRKLLRIENVGIYESKQDQSKSLVLTRNRALSVVKLVKPFVPSKKRLFEHFEMWETATTTEGQYQAALSYEAEKARLATQATVEKYDSLLEYPAFIAGLIDSRGSYFYQETSPTAYREGLKLYTCKQNLVHALHHRFLGSGTQKRKGTYMWNVEGNDYLNLMMIISPHLEVSLEISKRGGRTERQ